METGEKEERRDHGSAHTPVPQPAAAVAAVVVAAVRSRSAVGAHRGDAADDGGVGGAGPRGAEAEHHRRAGRAPQALLRPRQRQLRAAAGVTAMRDYKKGKRMNDKKPQDKRKVTPELGRRVSQRATAAPAAGIGADSTRACRADELLTSKVRWDY